MGEWSDGLYIRESSLSMRDLHRRVNFLYIKGVEGFPRSGNTSCNRLEFVLMFVGGFLLTVQIPDLEQISNSSLSDPPIFSHPRLSYSYDTSLRDTFGLNPYLFNWLTSVLLLTATARTSHAVSLCSSRILSTRSLHCSTYMDRSVQFVVLPAPALTSCARPRPLAALKQRLG